jgi:hypothetical protein
LAKVAFVNDGGSVDEHYYQQEIKVVDERLALAFGGCLAERGSGARLAAGFSALILSSCSSERCDSASNPSSNACRSSFDASGWSSRQRWHP